MATCGRCLHQYFSIFSKKKKICRTNSFGQQKNEFIGENPSQVLSPWDMLCKYKTTAAHSIPPTKVAKNACNLLANKVLDKNVVFKNTHTSFKTYI
jgi:hypothetical protein